jgi:Kyakuja-Dileera-Zisupton transposase
MNIDYTICEALKRFPNCSLALIIYDICCQWFKHFRERVLQSEWLELWEGIDITPAMGKWHLAAHIWECFTKFSLNFVEGSTQADGEILETLWSGLDEIAGLTQGMSTAHRQEVLDNYTNDSNWKKLLRIGISLF